MILLAESGSTKTDWRCLDATICLPFATEGINPYYQSTEEIAAMLAEKLLPQLPQKPMQAIYYYGTGITDDAMRNVLKEAFAAVFGQVPTMQIESDLVGAAVGLFGNQSGIACIAGTGSNSGFFDGQAIGFQVPPLGFWLGDEGSGGHLGKLLILSYLHREMPQDLRTIFEQRYGEISRLTVIEHAYQQAFPNRYFASFARFYTEQQHPFLVNLAKQSFSVFFEKYLVKYPTIQTSQIGFVGSVGYYFQEIIREIAATYQLENLRFLQSPMQGLVAYHSENSL